MPTKIAQLQSLNRTPTAYGYARVSHVTGFSKGESIPAQHQRIEDYYQGHLKNEGVAWGGTHDDGTNVSAYKIPFHCRPAGKSLIRMLLPGDHLILDKVDRIWRSMDDFVQLMQMFNNKNITVHIVNFLGSTIQNNSPMGEFILKQFVLLAELESTIKSERIKESHSVLRNRGRKTTATPPGCCVRTTKNGDKKISTLHWDDRERELMREIVRLLDEENLTWMNACPRIEQFRANLYNQEVRTIKQQSNDRKRRWPRLYQYEVAYRYLGIHDPCQIPRQEIIKEAARQHRRQRTIARDKANPRWNYPVSKIEEISPEQLMEIA